MDVLSEVREELHRQASEEFKVKEKRFFKESVNNLGVRTPVVRKIARDHYPKKLSKEEVFALCHTLLEGYMEDKTIAFQWAWRLKKQFSKGDFFLFERWLDTYVDNWGSCDDFCTHTLGYMLLMFPEFLGRLDMWTRSENRWMRRGAAVSLIYPLKKGEYLDKAFSIATLLMQDEDDLVQKGYGWMLKVASQSFPEQVFGFVMEHKDAMPRTALRYAIEKYPEDMRKRAMK